jgi:predicted porin
MDTTPKGAPNANAEIIGGTYVIGPWQFGASYYVFDDQGNVQLTGVSQRHGDYYAFDAAYQITPGILAYAGWLYATNHQSGYNFVTGEPGSAAHNNAKTNGAIVGLLVGW